MIVFTPFYNYYKESWRLESHLEISYFSLIAKTLLTSSKAFWICPLVWLFWSCKFLIFFSTSLFLIDKFSIALSTLSRYAYSSPLMTGCAFLMVFTSWSLCLPTLNSFYRGWCIPGKYTHTCSRNRNRGCLHLDVLRIPCGLILLQRPSMKCYCWFAMNHSYILLLVVAHRPCLLVFIPGTLLQPRARTFHFGSFLQILHMAWLVFVLAEWLVSTTSRCFRGRAGSFHSKSSRQCSELSHHYVCSFFLLELKGQSFGCAIETEVVAAREHENILWDFLAFDAALRVVRIHLLIYMILICLSAVIESL